MPVERQGRLTAPSPLRTVVIAGAGIAGLTGALALARQHVRVIVLEKAAQFESLGAGIQLSPNATRILIELGVTQALMPDMVAPSAIEIGSGNIGRKIVRLALDNAISRYGAPYWVTHRADLHAALLARVREQPDIELRLGCEVRHMTVNAGGITVRTSGGTVEPAMALIGADGIWSRVRQHHFQHRTPPRYSGFVVWRGMADAAALPAHVRDGCVQLWLNPASHIVAYPVRGGERINLVAVIRQREPQSGASPQAGEIVGRLTPASSSSPLRELLAAVDTWSAWPLFSLDDGDWTSGPVALIGDAAHAMLPFAAQGAAMAMEDAAALAQCMSNIATSADVSAAFARFAALRRVRVARVAALARQNARIYHLPPPLDWARNVAMRMLGGERLLARQDWVYDWRVDA